MTNVPAKRHRQEVEVALEASDSYARVQLPDGRVVVVYGNGQLSVVVGTQTRYYRLPVVEDEVPSRKPTVGAAPRRPARAAVSTPAPAVVTSVPVAAVSAPVPSVPAPSIGNGRLRFVSAPPPAHRRG